MKYERLRYKLQGKSMPHALAILFPETLKSTAGFAACSAMAGCIYGPIYNMPVNPTNVIDVGETRTAFLVGIFSSIWFARNAYKGFKAEKQRYMELIKAVDQEKNNNEIQGDEEFIEDEFKKNR